MFVCIPCSSLLIVASLSFSWHLAFICLSENDMRKTCSSSGFLQVDTQAIVWQGGDKWKRQLSMPLKCLINTVCVKGCCRLLLYCCPCSALKHFHTNIMVRNSKKTLWFNGMCNWWWLHSMSDCYNFILLFLHIGLCIVFKDNIMHSIQSICDTWLAVLLLSEVTTDIINFKAKRYVLQIQHI